MSKFVFQISVLIAAVSGLPQLFRSDVEIVGGHDTDITQHKWQVSVRRSGFHSCGGSLIADAWVLTAAHCLDSAKLEDLTVKVGSTFRNSGGRQYNVYKMVINSDWQNTDGDGDIALLQLTEAVSHPNASTIDLPTQDEKLIAGTDISVTGWGDTEEGSGLGSEVLQEVVMPVVSHEYCASVYYYQTISEKLVCAGLNEGGKSSCQGDSGGPGVANRKLFGVVSRGNGCARPGFPGIYTNVASYVLWINDVIDERK